MIKGVRPATEEIRTVLVVEDEILLRIMVADELREAGMRVIEAANADEAMDHFAAGSPIDFVFTDIELPGSIDGLELVRRLQLLFPGLRLLVTSGRTTGHEASSLAPFIAKPYDLVDVVARIRVALAGPIPE